MTSTPTRTRPRVTTRRLVVVGILVSLLLAGVVSFYASSHPDGLEFVAREKGFSGSAGSHRGDGSPFAGYASLSGDSVMRHVRDTEDVEHLREILAFEQAHKNRKGVVGALNERLTELAGASA